MSAINVTAAVSEGAEIEFPYDFGDNLQEAIELFGEAVVWAYCLKGLTVAVQGHARGMIKSGKSPEEIQAAMAAYKPGTPRVTKSKEDRARELLASLSAEERAKILKDLKASKAAA